MGAKRVLSDESYEDVISNATADDLPYDVSFDADAEVVDLAEGTALLWPLNSPHRVDNQSFCVSVTTEYSTQESGLKNAAMLTNATLRERFGVNPSYEQDGSFKRRVKSVAGRVLGKTGFAPDTTEPDMVTFRIDETSDNFMTDVEAFERSF